MEFRIVNVYNNNALDERDLIGAHGESFYITAGDKQVLFDLGWKGKIFLHNMNQLGIDPDKINKLVFSHGHRDHTGGLPAFLKARTLSTPIPIIGHPNILEPKSRKMWRFHRKIGIPKLGKKLSENVEFQLTKEPVDVYPKLSTTGEIAISQRQELTGSVKFAYHKIDGKWEWDPIVDDQSLILQTKDGLVIITGCSHAGLLNTCEKATSLFNEKIKAVLGGTHMLPYSIDDIEHVGDVLEERYGTPELYLNHCTGNVAIGQLKKRFGEDIFHGCHVGTELIFEC